MDENNYHHVPVLLKEVITSLKINENDYIIDCNFGGGGHSVELIKNGAVIIGIDYDEMAIKYGYDKYRHLINTKKLYLVNDNFKNIEQIVKKMLGAKAQVGGIIYDLGLSTFQIKQSNRGFSFMDNSELDMRSSDDLNVKASDLIKVLSVKQLESLLRNYGEVENAKALALFIKNYGLKNKMIIASEFASSIKKYVDPFGKFNRIHPATKVFQAFRIAVNSEFENLEKSLSQCSNILKKGGRVCVIAFHSLEEKISAKVLSQDTNLKRVHKISIKPSFDEMKSNISSRSARMLIYEKIN